MNEKLSLPAAAATPIEQLQQQQQQQHANSSICATIDHADYHYESTLPAATASTAPTATKTTAYKHESNSTSNNAKACGIDVGTYVEGGGAVEAGGGGVVAGSELYRYASVASLGGGCGNGGASSKMLSGMDAFMASTGAGTAAAITAGAPPLVAPSATILKISNNSSASGSKGSNLNSPRRQRQLGGGGGGGAPQRDNFCGCFGGGGGVAGSDGKGMAHEADGDKQQLAALTFWPALFANLGICTLLLGYLFIGSFLFLTIETSGDGGSAAGVVSDPNAWSYAQNAYISTQQQQQQHRHTPEHASVVEAQPKLYKPSEPLLDVATAGGEGVHLQGAAVADGGKPHKYEGSADSSGNFHVNTSNVKRQAAVNDTTAGAVAMSVAHGDVTAQPENPETYIDNRHANKLRQQQPNDVATYTTLQRQAKAVEAQAFRRAAVNAIDAAIGSDINGAVDEVDVGGVVGVAMAEGEAGDGDMASAAAGTGGAWGGENVALQRTVENIWDITVSLNILYKENWTKLAALEINKFQDQLVKRLVMDLTLSTASTTTSNDAYSRHQYQQQQQQQLLAKQENNFGQQQPSQPYDYHSMEPAATSKHYGNDATQQRQQQQQQLERYWQLQAARQRQWLLQQQQQQFEWNFATSFLYSLTVVTTVGEFIQILENVY
ncbi:uncharacterized protein LOC118752753 [Rhagoletis pomonella]|uniref:uncharacterized protein LOC118752753 n=1 Tax=Rhagoletis pomonella TaxID=28610 RepID=UPI00177CF75E|nr:uncharacterized protein LOC118752753 [Rhagoletis pomonella]